MKTPNLQHSFFFLYKVLEVSNYAFFIVLCMFVCIDVLCSLYYNTHRLNCCTW